MLTNANELVQPQRLNCRSYLQHFQHDRKFLKCYFEMSRIFRDGQIEYKWA